eukprot:366551-Chlamydomonas_euryale.AAC.6
MHACSVDEAAPYHAGEACSGCDGVAHYADIIARMHAICMHEMNQHASNPAGVSWVAKRAERWARAHHTVGKRQRMPNVQQAWHACCRMPLKPSTCKASAHSGAAGFLEPHLFSSLEPALSPILPLPPACSTLEPPQSFAPNQSSRRALPPLDCQADPPEAPADEACTAAAAMAEVEQAAVNSCGAAAQSKRAAQKQASGAAGKSFKKRCGRFATCSDGEGDGELVSGISAWGCGAVEEGGELLQGWLLLSTGGLAAGITAWGCARKRGRGFGAVQGGIVQEQVHGGGRGEGLLVHALFAAAAVALSWSCGDR